MSKDHYFITRDTVGRGGFYQKYAVTDMERRSILRDTSPQALLLFEYYLRMASIGDMDIFDDGAAAHHFGWAEKTIKRWRRILQNAGYVSSMTSQFRNINTKATVYMLGAKHVAEAKESK